MAKKAYIGVNNTAKKVKKMYVGVGGVAKKVKKGYIGINGVARLFFSGGGTIGYYGTATPLSEARSLPEAATIGNHAIIQCGLLGSGTSAVVDSYDSSLVRNVLTPYNNGHWYGAAAATDAYAFFGGADDYMGVSVYAYNSSLVRSSAPDLPKGAGRLAAAAVGEYALFGGGKHYEYSSGQTTASIINNATAYDSSLTKTVCSNLREKSYDLAATRIGDYALFGGGTYSENSYGMGSYTAKVTSYNTSLTRGSVSDLNNEASLLAATAVGDYALFGGGKLSYNGDQNSTSVTGYNKSLTKVTVPSLGIGRNSLGAASADGYAIFGGGIPSYSTLSDAVDTYDASLTHRSDFSLSVARCRIGATSVGNYALFAGGQPGNSSSTTSSVVDVFQVS